MTAPDLSPEALARLASRAERDKHLGFHHSLVCPHELDSLVRAAREREHLRSVLGWTASVAKAILAGRSVRNADEVLAAADAALRTTDVPARNGSGT